MNFSKILPTLQALAPTIATGLLGPVGGLAVNALEEAFGMTPGSAEADGGAALTKAVLGMTPETAAAMRKADQDFAVAMERLKINVEELAQKDRDGARNMQIQTRDPTPRILAAAIVVGFFSLLSLMAFRALPEGNAAILNVMIGSLGAAVGAIVQFYFGSSASSQAKDATIKDLKKA